MRQREHLPRLRVQRALSTFLQNKRRLTEELYRSADEAQQTFVAGMDFAKRIRTLSTQRTKLVGSRSVAETAERKKSEARQVHAIP